MAINSGACRIRLFQDDKAARREAAGGVVVEIRGPNSHALAIEGTQGSISLIVRPHFTVFIPVYNDAGRVARAIQSVLDQTMPDFELIVSDDCSRDGTAQIVKEFKDRRLHLIENEKNLGCGGEK